MIELLTGTAALAAYLGSFLDFGSGAAEAVPSRRPPSRPYERGVISLASSTRTSTSPGTPSSATTSVSSSTL